MRREQSWQRPWIFLLIFCCSSNICVQLWIWCETHPKMGLVIFISLYTSLICVQLLSLPRHILQPTLFQTHIISICLVSEWGTYPFFVVPHPHRRFGTSVFFFLIILNSLSFTCLFCRISVCFSFLFFSSLSPSSEIILSFPLKLGPTISCFIYIYIYIYCQTFFVWALLLIVHTWNSSPLQAISSGCNALIVPFQQLLEGPMEVLLCQCVSHLCHSLFHLNYLITTASELRE